MSNPFLVILLILLTTTSCGTSGGAGHGSPDVAQAGGVATIVVDYKRPVGVLDPFLFGAQAAPITSAYGFALSQQAGFRVLGVAVQMPWPENPADPACYDFTTLDEQVAGTIGAGAEPLIVFAPVSPPENLEDYGAFAANVARHLTRGWADGHGWPVRLFRFGNEPANPSFWRGSQKQFFETYAAWARALKAVDPAFILVTPGAAGARDPRNPDAVDPWILALLDYCEANGVPVDFVSFHIYSLFPPAYYEDARLVKAELDKHPTLSPLYGAPRLANDEWNITPGDVWSGHYNPAYDSAWPAPMLIGGLINMIEGGLSLSVPLLSTFNGDANGCHDFPLVDCEGNPKPAWYAFRAFNQLAGATRLQASGGDHMNLAVLAGRAGDDVIVVIANNDLRGYLTKYEPPDSPAWNILEDLTDRYGESTYEEFALTLRNLPRTSGNGVHFERFVVDGERMFEIVESSRVPGSDSLTFHGSMTRPSVQIVRLRPTGQAAGPEDR